AAASENVHIRRALNSPLEFIRTGADKDGMRVGVDEARQNNFAGRVKFLRRFVRKAIGRPDPPNDAVTDRNGAVVDDARFVQLASAPRAGPRSYCHELPSMNQIQILMPFCFANSRASSYPASACRATPIPGSFVSTRLSRSAMESVP